MRLLLQETTTITKQWQSVPDRSQQRLIWRNTTQSLKIVSDGFSLIDVAVELDDLIRHSLLALRETIQSSADGLNAKNCSVGIVGENQKFEILEGQRLQSFVTLSL